MLSGIIFIQERIVSTDLQNLLSQYYKIVNVFRNVEQAPEHFSDIDFIIIDADPYSDQELRAILKKLNMDSSVNIITMTSSPPGFKSKTVEAEMHISSPIKIIEKPYDEYAIICAIEGEPLSFY